MAKLRHVAIAVPDPEKSAEFYCKAFDLSIVGRTESPLASGVYLSDGTMGLALLNYKNDESAGLEKGKDFVGIHHLGFWCEDLEGQRKEIEANGGEFFMELPAEKDTLDYEMKFRDPDNIIFDISHNGWAGAKL